MRAAIPPAISTKARIDLSPVEPAKLSFRQPMGVDFNLALSIHGRGGTPIDPTPFYPQFALLPRSRFGSFAYDMEVTDAENGVASVSIPGTAIMDRNGYDIEVYARQNADPNPPKPIGLIAQGVMRITGTAYQQLGPLGPISTPVIVGPPGPEGPEGPASMVSGPAGEDGERGSLWLTGEGPPPGGDPDVAQHGDMYLDTLSGDIWRYDATLGTWTLV